jgi:phosphatidylinositol glycan class B
MSISEKYWFLFAFLIYLVAAWFSVGHYHDDEYYQILDFAAYKLGFEMQNTVMWEYKEGVRSGLQPFIAYVVAKGLTLFGITSPFIWAFYLRLISLIISFISVFTFFHVIKKEVNIEKIRSYAVFFLLFSWILVFLNVRFSSEGWATSLFIFAYALYFYQSPTEIRKYFFIGLLLGFAFLSRYQIGLFIFGFCFWLLFQGNEKISNFWLAISGFILSLAIGVLIDYWLYEELTFSFWNYFEWHIVKGSIDNIVEPWWFYVYYSMVQLIPPITLFVPLVIIIFWTLFPRHSITWITIPFIAFHHYFGHKEMRYLFPVIPFLPVMFAMTIENLLKRFKYLNQDIFKLLFQSIIYISLFINIILVLLTVTLPASKEVALWQNCFTQKIPSDSVLLTYDPDGSGSTTGELELDFYNINNVPIISISDEIEISKKMIEYPGKKLFYAARKKGREAKLTDNGISSKLICQALPEWILKININNWTSRASIWQIWEIIK